MTSRFNARPPTAIGYEPGHGPTWGLPRVSPAPGHIVVAQVFTGPRSRRRGHCDGHAGGLPHDLKQHPDAGRIFTAGANVSGRPTPYRISPSWTTSRRSGCSPEMSWC
jgi:hypothetical protein